MILPNFNYDMNEFFVKIRISSLNSSQKTKNKTITYAFFFFSLRS